MDAKAAAVIAAAKRVIGFRPVKVGGCCIEIDGLDDVFQEYFKMGKKPEDKTGNEIVKDVAKLNFIPEDAEDLYKEAFLREYQSYCDAKSGH